MMRKDGKGGNGREELKIACGRTIISLARSKLIHDAAACGFASSCVAALAALTENT